MPFLNVPKTEVPFFHHYFTAQTEHKESFFSCVGSVIFSETKMILVYKIASHLQLVLSFTHGASICLWSRVENMLTVL